MYTFVFEVEHAFASLFVLTLVSSYLPLIYHECISNLYRVYIICLCSGTELKKHNMDDCHSFLREAVVFEPSFYFEAVQIYASDLVLNTVLHNQRYVFENDYEVLYSTRTSTVVVTV